MALIDDSSPRFRNSSCNAQSRVREVNCTLSDTSAPMCSCHQFQSAPVPKHYQALPQSGGLAARRRECVVLLNFGLTARAVASQLDAIIEKLDVLPEPGCKPGATSVLSQCSEIDAVVIRREQFAARIMECALENFF